MSENKKPVWKRVINVIGYVLMFAVVIFIFVRYLGPLFGSNDDGSRRLDTPANIDFSFEKKVITWSPVENANVYYVKINDGDETKVVETSMPYIATFKSVTVSVKASSSTAEYPDSDWSEPATFENNEICSYQAVCEFVTNILAINITSLEGVFLEDNRTFRVVATIAKRNTVHEILCTYDEDIHSIEEALTIEPIGIREVTHFSISEYHSAESLVESGELDGQLEQYRQDGWKISVVSDVTTKLDRDDIMCIYGIFKLTKGDETKYVYVIYDCMIRHLSPYEFMNYSDDIINVSNRRLYEISFHEFTPEEIDFLRYNHDLNVE